MIFLWSLPFLTHCMIPSYLTLYTASITKKYIYLMNYSWIMYLLLRAQIFLVFVYFFHNCWRTSWLWNIFLSSTISQRYTHTHKKLSSRFNILRYFFNGTSCSISSDITRDWVQNKKLDNTKGNSLPFCCVALGKCSRNY